MLMKFQKLKHLNKTAEDLQQVVAQTEIATAEKILPVEESVVKIQLLKQS